MGGIKGVGSQAGSRVARRSAAVLLAAGLSVWPALAGSGQVTQGDPSLSPRGPQAPFGHNPAQQAEPLSPQQVQHIERMREDDRRKRLLADTARLVALSGELQSEVEKASKDELSLEVVRKAAEIEKLAHDVKERMKS